MPDDLDLMIFPLKKSFVALLDCAVDHKVLLQLRRSSPTESYALDAESRYRLLAKAVNGEFKAGLDNLVSGLRSLEIRARNLCQKFDGELLQLQYDAAVLVLTDHITTPFLKMLLDPLSALTTHERYFSLQFPPSSGHLGAPPPKHQ